MCYQGACVNSQNILNETFDLENHSCDKYPCLNGATCKIL